MLDSLTVENETNRGSRNVGTQPMPLTSQKSEGVIYIAEEAWNFVFDLFVT
jgi:hypothetical protein